MKKSIPLNMRLEPSLSEALDARAAEEGMDRSSVVRAALKSFLAAPSLTVEQRLNTVERAVAEINRRLDATGDGRSPN